jgi:hypothetical protein
MQDHARQDRDDPWEPLKRFLGATLERINEITGLPDVIGCFVKVKMVESISKMYNEFKYLIKIFNTGKRVRHTLFPLQISSWMRTLHLNSGNY